MKLICSLLAVLMLTVGCGGTGLYQYHGVEPEANNQHARTMPVYVDKNFNTYEISVIVNVVNEWNYALNGYMTFVISPRLIDSSDKTYLKRLDAQITRTNEGIMLIGVDHDNPMVKKVVDEVDGVLAFVNGLGESASVMAVLRDRIGGKNLHKILLHEFGHALGGMHVSAPSLMYPYLSYRQRDCIDKITASQVATHNGLDLNHMNYCATPNFE